MEILSSKHAARATLCILLLMLAAGAWFTLANRGLPLVRNSLVYARASENIAARGYDPRPVVADSALSYDKPILYPWSSAAFVRALGNHDGLRLTSFLTTATVLLALIHFAASFKALLPAGQSALFLWLCALGPCVFYQFWSAHPDGWFAALTVFAWSLTHRITVEPNFRALRRVCLLGACVYVAILLKNYGLVLLLSCPLYLVWHARKLRAECARFQRLTLGSIAVFATIGALVLLAWRGLHPLSRLEGEGGGVGQYASGELWRSAWGTWVQLGLALLVQFQIALVFLLRKEAWCKPFAAPLMCFGGIYVLGLMPFPTTFYNMRYFVPLFALVGLMLVRGVSAISPTLRRMLLVGHGALGILLVLVFNVAPIFRWAEPAVPKLEVNWIGVPLSLLDNLRMKLHLEQALVLERINSALPRDAILYMLDVNYYRDAQQGVYERAGLIRGDIATRYAASNDFHPSEAQFFVFSRRPLQLESLGKVTRLAEYLYRVE